MSVTASEWRAPGADCPHPVVLALAEIRARLVEIADQPLWGLRDDELLAVLQESYAATAQLQALEMRLAAETGSRQIVNRRGATSPVAWLIGNQRVDPGQAKGDVELGKALEGEFTATLAAFAAGDIHRDHVRAIVKSIDAFPDEATESHRRQAEEKLLDLAKRRDPRCVRNEGRTVLEQIDPELYDQHLGKQLEREEARAERDRLVQLVPLGNGRTRLKGILTESCAQALRSAIEPLAKPLPSNADEPDLRTASQRNHDAAEQVLRRYLASSEAPSQGGNGTETVITITDHDLWAKFGHGMYLRDGTPVSAGQVRKDMCDGKITVTWFDEDYQSFWMSEHPERGFTGKKRRALELRDKGCAFPSCNRPPSWCDGHHIIPWALGGATVLTNGVLLCAAHHKLIHRGEWVVRMTKDGLPEFIPPAFVDPEQQPQRHARHRHS